MRLVSSIRIGLLTVLLLFLVAVLFVRQSEGAESSILQVAPNGTGDCITSPCGSIYEAVLAASDGDTIQVAAGVYKELIKVDKNVSIVGESADNTIIDTNQSLLWSEYGYPITDGSIFEITQGSNVTISNLTIQEGWNTYRKGGGIINYGTLSIDNVIIQDNIAGALLIEGNAYGGGIYNEGEMIITESIIRDNYPKYDNPRPVTSYETFGAGIFNSGSLTIFDSTIDNNYAPYVDDMVYGGGIYNEGDLEVYNSTISNNSSEGSGEGMGVYNKGTALIVNTTFSGNESVVKDQDAWSTIHNDDTGTVEIYNSTLSDELIPFVNIGNGNISVGNSIINHPTSYTNCATITSLGNNLTEGSDCGMTHADDISFGVADLGPLQDNGGFTFTRALQASSSALEGGNNATCSASPVNGVDQRGETRPAGNTTCDIGAYESSLLAPQFVLSHTDDENNRTVVNVSVGAMADDINLGLIPDTYTTPPPAFQTIDVGFELDAFKAGVLQEDFVFDSPITMTLNYEDANVHFDAQDEVVLMVEENGTWVDAATTCAPASTYTRDDVNNLISIDICHLSHYGWFAPAAPSAVSFSASQAQATSGLSLPILAIYGLLILLSSMGLLFVWRAQQ